MAAIRFNYADVLPISLPGKSKIKLQIAEIFANEGKELKKLNYIFCSDNLLIGINKSFLQHDFFTDVITFNLSEGKEITGEVYISINRVKENAIIYGATYKNELLRLIFHAALHLCGYKDKKKSEITRMRQKEDYYLQLLKKKYQ